MKTTNKIRLAGKSIGGGNLYRVSRGADVIGTVVSIACGTGWIAQRGLPSEHAFSFHDNMSDAFDIARSWR